MSAIDQVHDDSGEAWRARAATFIRECKGASAVEFALVLPIFIILLFGTFAVSQAIYAQAQMRFAVQDSSRTFMVNPSLTPSQMEAAISVHLSRLNQTKILWINAVDTDNSDGTRTTELRVGYQYDLSIPMVAAWPLVFETKTEILREQPKSP